MKINCTDEEILIFKKISDAAGELSIPAFIVGGFVRDKILGRKTKDADIVCEGDGIQLAHATAAKFAPAPKVSFFKNFGSSSKVGDSLVINVIRKDAAGNDVPVELKATMMKFPVIKYDILQFNDSPSQEQMTLRDIWLKPSA